MAIETGYLESSKPQKPVECPFCNNRKFGAKYDAKGLGAKVDNKHTLSQDPKKDRDNRVVLPNPSVILGSPSTREKAVKFVGDSGFVLRDDDA